MRRTAYTMLVALVMATLAVGTAFAEAQVAPGGSEERSSAGLERRIAKDVAELDRETEAGPPERRVDEDARGNPYVAGELIVTYEEGVSAAAEQAAVREAEARVEEDLSEIDADVLLVPEVKGEPSEEAREETLEDKKRELEQAPSVEAVDYNYLREKQATPNDPLFGQQWGLQRVNAPQAHDTTRGAGAVVAIVDGGAQSSHPDLSGAVIDEYDYYNGDATPNDEDGHGTHVSGIAAARTNNSKGIASTAPEAALLNYDVCGVRYCTDAAIIDAINDAADLGADVINMSLGSTSRSTAEENAVNYAWNKGVVVVAAAGNESSSTPSYPGAYTNVIAVSGTDYNNGDSDFSNYGSWVDVAAPGGEDGAPYGQRILSSVPTSVSSSGYDAWNGTSMASPFVAGVAGLLASQDLTGAQIRQRIESTTTDLGAAGKDQLFGNGLINAQAATAGGGTPPAPSEDTTTPSGTVTINGGAANTRKANVKLTLSATDNAGGTGVKEMRFSNDGQNWSAWEPYATSKPWTLPTGKGTKTVYVEFRDGADNVSPRASDSIFKKR